MTYDEPNLDPRLYRRFEDDPYPNEKTWVPKILLTVLILVAVTILIGTIIAFTSKKGKFGNEYRQADPTPEKVINRSGRSTGKVTTTNLGMFRLSTKPEEGESNGTFMVVTPWFSYPENDVQLFEEISQKDRQLKSVVSNFFTNHTKSEIFSMGEKKVKEELKNAINQQLIMGDINEIYFEQYIFFSDLEK